MPVRFGDRTLFPELAPWAYLSHAAISPPSTRVLRAATEAIEHHARHGLGAWSDYREQRDRWKRMCLDLGGGG